MQVCLRLDEIKTVLGRYANGTGTALRENFTKLLNLQRWHLLRLNMFL